MLFVPLRLQIFRREGKESLTFRSFGVSKLSGRFLAPSNLERREKDPELFFLAGRVPTFTIVYSTVYRKYRI